MEIHGIIRTLYLYVAAFVGLALVTAGGVRLVELGLRATVFTQAEAEMRMQRNMPPPMMLQDRFGRNLSEMTPEERTAWSEWLASQRRWQTEMRRIDPVASQRARAASSALAMLLIGLPLYLYHWRVIRRELRQAHSPGSRPQPLA
jgi:hypothetical protein